MQNDQPRASRAADTQRAQPSPQGASDSEKHAFLVAVLKDALSTTTDRMFKHSAFLTLFLGWIISSDTARELFRSSDGLIACICSFLLFLYTVLFAYWTDRWRRRSQSALQHLVELGYMPIEFYSAFRIDTRLAVSFIGLHAVICFAIIVFINSSSLTSRST